MRIQTPTPPLTVPGTADEAARWRLGRRLEDRTAQRTVRAAILVLVAAVNLVFVGAVLSPCSRAMPPPEAAAAAPEYRSAGAPDPASRKLIRTVELELEVEDTEEAAEAVRRLAESLQGYVPAVQAERQEQLLHYQMTLGVPEGHLDLALERLKGLRVRVLRESLATQAVTERYVDLEARLRILHGTEAELPAAGDPAALPGATEVLPAAPRPAGERVLAGSAGILPP